MALSTSDLMRQKDEELKAKNSSIPDFTYDEKVTPDAISKITGKDKNNSPQNRAQSAFAAIKAALNLTKEEKIGPITQPNALKLEQIETGVQNNKENEEPSIDDGDER